MIKWRSLCLYNCTECGKLDKNTFEIEVATCHNSDKRGYARLCPECRKNLINTLIRITPDSTLPEEPHGGKWFQIWKEDKEGIIATMYKNLSADLDAGYSYSGNSIQSQLEAIEEYRKEYNKDLDRFVYMSDAEVSRWCYYDMKKRGAIA